MEIKVTVEAAPELMAAIDNLTAALIEIININVNLKTGVETKETKPIDNAKPADKPADRPTLTLETVRAKLANLSQSGKQKEVKAIIESFGVKKLTDIPAEKYPEVMEKAAELEAES